MHGRGDVVPTGPEEVAAQAGLGGEADGVQHAVDAAPAPLQLRPEGGHVLRVGDVELQHVGLGRQTSSHPLRQAHGPPERGEDDLGALLLGQPGRVERDALRGEHARDEEFLGLEQHP